MAFWFTLVIYVALFALSLLLKPKQNIENAKPGGLGDFGIPTATEGRSVPIIFGTIKLQGPNTIWYGDFQQEAITETVSTGMFSSEEVVVGYEYSIGLQFGLALGELDALTKIWVGPDIVFSGELQHNDFYEIDEPDLFGGDDLGNGGVKGQVRFQAGTKTQNPSTYLQAQQQSGGETPGYRGFSHLMGDENTYIGNSTNLVPWSFEARRIPTGPATGADESIGSTDADANPVNAIYEILTNSDWGLGIDPSMVDATSFADAGAVLATEGNGVSFILDNPQEAIEVIHIVEEQIDGILFFNRITKQYQINLARGDYDIQTVPQIGPDETIEIKNFARGSWEDTTNQVRCKFTKRGAFSNYHTTYALAEDMGNRQIQDGVNIYVEQTLPACKRRSLANSIAWRTLRGLSYPTAKASLIVDTTFYMLQPGQVIAYTNPDLGFTQLPMRITRIDFGRIEEGEIALELVQDIYLFSEGSFGDPPDTDWEDPQDDLDAIPSDEQLAFESPRKFNILGAENANGARIWCGGRKQGNEVSFRIRTRTATPPSVPSGNYQNNGQAFAFMKIGTLTADLDAGSAVPLTSFLVSPGPDTQLDIEAAFGDNPALADMGTNLVNLILIDDEFMLPRSAQTSVTDVQLNNVYRGVMDSVQADHATGADVYLMFVGGSLTNKVLDDGDNVDVVLAPRSTTDQVADGDATAVEIRPLDKRSKRPYAPSDVSLDSSLFASTVSLEADGTGPEDYSFEALVNRRDFRSSGDDEIQALLNDAAVLFDDFPTDRNTRQQYDVRNDPDGADTFLYTLTDPNAAKDILRIDLLIATSGILPTRLRLAMRALHDFGSTDDLTSREDLVWDFDVTSGLTGQFNFGVLDTNIISNVYTATQAGTHNFTLSSAFTAGDVEYRLNGGTWTQLIAAGGTAGSIAGVVATDTIEVRHLSTDSSAKKQLDMAAPVGGQNAYAILIT